MNIAVYCASRPGSDPEFINEAKALGHLFGSENTLVYGGSMGGLMGAVADAALESGAGVIGIQPTVEAINYRRHPGLTEFIQTDTVAERRTGMIERAQAFIALPGGLGTLDEISEVLSLMSLNIVNAPVAFVNTNGYYAPLKAFFDGIIKNGLGVAEYFKTVCFAKNSKEAMEFVLSKG